MGVINGGTIVAILEMDTSKYGSAMKSAVAQAGILNDISATTTAKLQGIGKAMGTVGTTMTLGLTMPIIGFGTAAVKSASDAESAFAGVRKTVDASEAEFASLKQSLVDLSEEIPTSFADLSKITEMAGQLGVDNADLLKFTRTIADLGVATNLSGEEAATMLAQYANVTGMPLANIDRLGSVIVALGNNAATTERDIAEMAQRLSGAAQVLGLTDAQTMGLSATMAELGINAEAGGSAMSRVMSTMQQAVLAGGKDLSAFAKVAGTTGKSFASTFKGDPIAALNLFVQGLGKIKAAGGDVYAALEGVELQDLRITDTLLRMSGASEGLTDNIDLANAAWGANNALVDEAAKRYATVESQLQLAKNSVSNMMASLGELVLPVVVDITQGVGDAAKAINTLDKGTKGFVLTILGLVAAAGPLSLVIGGLISLLTGPVGIVVGIIAAGAAVGALISHVTTLNQKKIDNDLAQRFGAIKLSASELDAILAKGFTSPVINYDAIKEAESGIAASVTNINNKVTELDKTIYLAMMTNDSKALALLPGQITAIVGEARSLLSQENNKIQLAVTGLFGADDPDGTKLKGEFAEYFDVLDADATAKGNQLRKAVDNSIADGVIDAEEEKIIVKLRQELQEIISRGMMLDAQVEIENLRIDASKADLSIDSIKGLEERIASAKAAAQKEVEELYAIDRNATIKLGLIDNKGQDWIDENVNDLTEERDEKLGSIDSQMALLGVNSYGKQVLAAYQDDMANFQADYQKITDDAIKKAQEYALNGIKMMGLSLGTPEGQQQFNELFSIQYEQLFLGSGEALENIVPDQAVIEGAKQRLDAMQPTIESAKKVVAALASLGSQLSPEQQGVLNDLRTFLSGVEGLQSFVDNSQNSSLPGADAVSGKALEDALALEQNAQAQAEAQANATPESRAQAALGDMQKYATVLTTGISQITDNAWGMAQAKLWSQGVNTNTADGAAKLQETYKEILGTFAGQIDSLVPESVREKAQAAVQALMPDIQAARDQAAAMGDNVTPELQQLLAMYDQIELLATGGGELVTQLQNAIGATAGSSGSSAADELGANLTTGIDAQIPAATSSGTNVGQGYVNGVLAKIAAAKAAGAALAKATDQGIRDAAQIASPSKLAEEEGGYTSQGYVNGVLAGVDKAYESGSDLAAASGKGTVDGDKKAETETEAEKKAREARERARARARQKAREAAELAAIKEAGKKALEADKAVMDARIKQLDDQYAAMMALIGDDAAYYKDTPLETELDKSKDYFDQQKEQAKKDYDDQVAKLGKKATKEQLKAAEDAYNERIAQLDKYAKEEQDKLRENYQTQQQIALDYIDKQREAAHKALDDKRKEAREDDYQDELADLQKRLRQSKSAKERRELQEQIDKMQRDHELDQEEEALAEQDEAWAQLEKGISTGVIGLADLLPNAANLPSVATGSGGLDALTNINPDMMQTLLSALRAGGETAKSSIQGFNEYKIDMRGAVVRNDDDVSRIVDELEVRLRSDSR